MPRVALIGCGAIADEYYLPALSKHPSVMKNLILVDRNETRLGEMCQKYDVEYQASDYSQIVDEVDGAIIALPTELHFPIGMEFLVRGVHVLCEKPLAEVAHKARLMTVTAKNNGAKLATNYFQRRIPHFAWVKDFLAHHDCGKLFQIDYRVGEIFDWPTVSGFYFKSDNLSRGILLDRGSHAVDHICWWLGGKPELISSKYDSFGGIEAVSHVRFRHGDSVGKLRLSWFVDIPCTFTIQCENARIEGDVYDYRRIVVHESRKSREVILDTPIKTKIDIADEIVTNFMDVLENKEEPLISGADVLDSIEFIDECYQSAVHFEMPWYQLSNGKEVQPKQTQGITLVTGAGGFIGGWLVDTLYLQGQKNVRAGVHTWRGAARPARFPMNIVPCDIMIPEQIDQAMKGVDCVIHCAKGGSNESIIEGTRNMLEAALKHKIKRFIHISTTEVFGNQPGEIDESDSCQSMGDAYGDSKIEAEKLCWEYYEKGVPVTIIRPPIVYGPFSKSFTVDIAFKLLSGNWGIYKKIGDGISNLIYVSDLVSGILLAVQRDDAVGEVFILNGPETVTWNQYFQKFNQALGLPALKVHRSIKVKLRTSLMEPIRSAMKYARYRFERPLRRIASKSRLAKRMMKSVEVSMKTKPRLHDVNLYRRKSVFLSEKAQEMLGFRPLYSLDEGLAMSVKWLRQVGLWNLPK